MAFSYSANLQNRISQTVFGVNASSLNAVMAAHLDGTWTSGALATGAAYDALTQIYQIANYFEMAGATSAPQTWESWLVWETACKLAKTYRKDSLAGWELEREKAIDTLLDSFTLLGPTGAFTGSNDSQAITMQGIRYFVLNHCARRKEASTNTGMRRRLFIPIDVIDSHTQWVLNYLYNKEHWSFRKRDVILSIKYLNTITAATWTESTKTLTQTGAFTNLSLTNGTAMIMVTDGTGAIVGEYQIASRTSDDAVVLTASLATANGNLATGDIEAKMFYLDFRGLLANETIDAVASRRFYYKNDSSTVGSRSQLTWIDSTGMAAAKAYNSTTTGQPVVFRFENQPSSVRSWRLAPFPDADYTLLGSVYVSGPGAPGSVSETTIFTKFPTEFGPVVRDMVLARVLQANNASDAEQFWSRAIENVATLLPSFVDQGSQTRLQTAEDVYGDMHNTLGGSNAFAWGGPFGGGLT